MMKTCERDGKRRWREIEDEDEDGERRKIEDENQDRDGEKQQWCGMWDYG